MLEGFEIILKKNSLKISQMTLYREFGIHFGLIKIYFILLNLMDSYTEFEIAIHKKEWIIKMLQRFPLISGLIANQQKDLSGKFSYKNVTFK